MVELLESQSSFDEDRVTMNTFLSSVKSWHKKTGVHCGVEKVYTKEEQGKFGKYTLFTLKMSILDDMSKCRARVLDDDGKVVIEEDNPNRIKNYRYFYRNSLINAKKYNPPGNSALHVIEYCGVSLKCLLGKNVKYRKEKFTAIHQGIQDYLFRSKEIRSQLDQNIKSENK